MAVLVSVALCTFNGAAYLPQQLESLLAQDHAPLELVAADDASTDDSWPILQHYAPRFAAARLLRNERNLGVRANFEQVLRQSRGDWIAPCDQDDVWRPHKLSRLLGATAPHTMLAYGDSELLDADGRPLHRRVSDRYAMVSGNDPLPFTFMNCVSGHAAIVRRDLLAKALPVPPGAPHDWWLAFVAAQSGGIVYVDEPLVGFRQHADNASGYQGQRKRRERSSRRDRQHGPLQSLQSLAAFPGPEQAFFAGLADRWRRAEGHRFTPELARWLYPRRHAVFAMRRTSPGQKWRHLLKYLFGPA